LRIIVDANVLISSALVSDSVPKRVFTIVSLQHTLLRSAESLKELQRVVYKEKFNKYFSVHPELREELVLSYLEIGRTVDITHRVDICRDRKDNIYLELALSGKADLIISGDSDLLVLNPFEGIPIIKPVEFLNKYQNA